MEKTRGLVELELIGTRIDVTVGGTGAAALKEAIRSSWDRCLASDPSVMPFRVVEVVLDNDPAALKAARARGAVAGSDELQVMSSLTSALTVVAIESRHGELLMLHACAMANPRTGSTVVLVAPSGTGKTTAALTLGTHLAYLTDETVAIGLNDVVIPYPKPLSLLTKGRPPKVQVSPNALGLHEAPPASRVCAVALLHRVSEPVKPTLTPVPILEALAAVAEQSSAIQLLPRPLHLIADLLDRTGGLRRVTYHHVDDAAPAIMDLLREDFR